MAKKPLFKEESDNGAAKWQRRFDKASSDQESLFKKFAQWYDAFNARVTGTGAPWRAKPYMPIIAQQVWALVAKFSSLRPGFEVRLRDSDAEDDEELEQRANIAEKKLEYDYDCPLMDEPMRDKLASVMIDACVTGTGLAEVNWKTIKKIRRERLIDPETGMADLTQEKVIESFVGYNDFEPINIFNVFVAPGAEDLYGAPWIIIRSYVPISKLKKQNNEKGGKFYQNLDKLSPKPAYGTFNTYNASRNRVMGQEPTDETVDTATIYKCYEGDTIKIFGEDKSAEGKNGWVLLRETKNYYWHGKYPLVKFHVKKRPFSFWGQGLAELAYRLQVIFNDVFAHYLDSWNLAVNPSFWAPEDAEVDDYVIEPGSINTYAGDTAPTPMNMKDPNPAALEMIVGLLQASIEGVTASQYATGMTNSATDKTKGTATGIAKIQDAAGDIVGYLRENLTTSIVQVGKMWFSNNQQFMDKPMQITVNDKGRRQTVTASPGDIKGDAEIYVDAASMVPKSDEEKRTDAQLLITGLTGLQQASMTQSQIAGTDPLYINFNELADQFGEGFSMLNMQSLLMTPEQVKEIADQKQAEAMQAGQNAAMGMPADPDEATRMMAEELAANGEIDPNEIEQGAQMEAMYGQS